MAAPRSPRLGQRSPLIVLPPPRGAVDVQPLQEDRVRSRLSLRSPAWGGGSCRRALFVLLVGAARCDRAEAPVEPPRFSSSAWAQEPAGLTVGSGYALEEPMSVGNALALSA